MELPTSPDVKKHTRREKNMPNKNHENLRAFTQNATHTSGNISLLFKDVLTINVVLGVFRGLP